jgi:hypothetical protein
MAYSGQKPKFLQSRITELAIPATTITTAGSITGLASEGNSNIRLTLATVLVSVVAPTSVPNGKILYVTNANTTEMSINNEDTGETTAANRIVTGLDGPLTVAAGSTVGLQYDSTSSRWRVFGGSGGSGSGTGFKNYLESWYTGSKEIGTVGTSNGLTNARVNETQWVSTNTGNITISKTTGSNLRGTSHYSVSGSGSGASTFIESPVFVLDIPDSTPSAVLYFTIDLIGTSTMIITPSLARYLSNGTYQETIATTAITLQGTSPGKYTLIFQLPVTYNATDKFGLRFAKNDANTFKFDSLFVGPQLAIDGGAQTIAGGKTFQQITKAPITELSLPSGSDISTSGTITALNAEGSSSLRLTSASALSGIIAPVGLAIGKILYLTNTSLNDLTINNENVSATAANRIITGTETSIVITPGGVIGFQYDSVDARWRVLGNNSKSSSGTFKNYLESWFTSDKDIGTVSVGTVSTSGNRSGSGSVWAASHSDMNITRTTTSLRGTYSYLVDFSAIGGRFIESPVFSFESGDVVGGPAVYMYLSFLLQNSIPGLDVAIVRYNSSLVYQGTLAVSSDIGGTIPYGGNRLLGYFTSPSGSTTDKYALRIRTVSPFGGSGSFTLDELYIGPNTDMNQQTTQRFPGIKEFADEVEFREGMNVPLTLDFASVKSVPSSETTFVGKLNVAAGTIINLTDASSNLVVVGAITGPGSISGSGIVTSI